MEKSTINYIIGIGRSGSTLLTTILNAHSKVKAIPEIPITIFFSSAYKGIKKKNEQLESQTTSYLNNLQRIRPTALVDLSANQLFSTETNYSDYETYLHHIFSKFEIAGKKGEFEQYIDKNPFYTFHYHKIKKLHANSKFIIIVRDYRANVLSRKLKQLIKPTNHVYNAFRWRFFFQAIHKLKGKNDCLVLRYEDLVSSEVTEIIKICTFLGLEFEPEMLTIRMLNHINHPVDDQKTKQFISKHFAGLAKPMQTDKIDAWKNNLSEKEIQDCDTICGRYGLDFGYQPLSKKKQAYFVLVITHFMWYLSAFYDIYKEQFIYFLPVQLKLWRLRKKTS